MEFKSNIELKENEKQAYIDYVQSKNPNNPIDYILVNIVNDSDGEWVELNWHFESIPFERIRRITGYLVGTVNRWNDAKKAEEKARVKHSITRPMTNKPNRVEEYDSRCDCNDEIKLKPKTIKTTKNTSKKKSK